MFYKECIIGIKPSISVSVSNGLFFYFVNTFYDFNKITYLINNKK